MRYRVTKNQLDTRQNTAFVFIPDGFFRIVTLTMRNHTTLQHLQEFGYIIEEEEKLAPGLYDEETKKQVTEASALAHAKDPGNNPLVYVKPGDKEPDVSLTYGIRAREMKANRLKAARGEKPTDPKQDFQYALSNMGIGFSQGESVGSMEQKLSQALADMG